jgi:hypothetical protein
MAIPVNDTHKPFLLLQLCKKTIHKYAVTTYLYTLVIHSLNFRGAGCNCSFAEIIPV